MAPVVDCVNGESFFGFCLRRHPAIAVLVYSMVMVMFECKFTKFMENLQASGGSVKQKRLREESHTVTWYSYTK